RADPAGHRLREVPVPALRHRAGADDDVPARGPDPEPTPAAGAARRGCRELRGPGTGRARRRGRVAVTAAAFGRKMASDSATGGLLLHADGITKRFGGLVAVHDIDFTIPTGSIVSLIGPNSAGTTTFFNIIAGIYDPTAGVVVFNGQEMIARSRRAWLEPFIWFLPGFIGLLTILTVAGRAHESDLFVLGGITLLALMSTMLIGVARPPRYQRALPRIGIFRSARPNDMVEAGLGRTFQNIRLFQNMTALENVLVGMHTKLRSTWADAMFSTPRDRREEKEAAEVARGYLRLVGLRGKDGELAKNLPYGDQRRLEIARALGSKPKLLLLNEPTAHITPRETQEMISLVNRLRTALALTVLLIEHAMKVVMSISDRVTVLD